MIVCGPPPSFVCAHAFSCRRRAGGRAEQAEPGRRARPPAHHYTAPRRSISRQGSKSRLSRPKINCCHTLGNNGHLQRNYFHLVLLDNRIFFSYVGKLYVPTYFSWISRSCARCFLFFDHVKKAMEARRLMIKEIQANK